MTYSVSPTQIFSKGPELVLTTAVEPPEYLLTGTATLLLGSAKPVKKSKLGISAIQHAKI